MHARQGGPWSGWCACAWGSAWHAALGQGLKDSAWWCRVLQLRLQLWVRQGLDHVHRRRAVARQGTRGANVCVYCACPCVFHSTVVGADWRMIWSYGRCGGSSTTTWRRPTTALEGPRRRAPRPTPCPRLLRPAGRPKSRSPPHAFSPLACGGRRQQVLWPGVRTSVGMPALLMAQRHVRQVCQRREPRVHRRRPAAARRRVLQL